VRDEAAWRGMKRWSGVEERATASGREGGSGRSRSATVNRR
jgi:hypothetical protein